MPTSKLRKYLTVTVATVAAGAGIAISVAQFAGASEPIETISGAIQSDASQVTSAENSFTTALTADRMADAPPAATYGKTAEAAIAEGKPAPEVVESVRQQQLQDGLATLGRYFTPGQAQHEAVGLRRAVANEADPRMRNIGMGVSEVKFVHVSVQDTTATVEADVTIWAKSQLLQPNGKWLTASPVNVMDYAATMVRTTTGQWLVSSLVGDFVPGEGP